MAEPTVVNTPAIAQTPADNPAWKDLRPKLQRRTFMTYEPQALARGWRRLPPADLETLILKVRREAAHRHLTAAEWRTVRSKMMNETNPGNDTIAEMYARPKH
jgi:hypothetical protein